MKKIALHWQILIGLLLGLVYGVLAHKFHWKEFTIDWVKPWGDIFISCLKLIAVPLVLFSLVSGIGSLADISRLSKIGSKTVIIYLSTTVIAITIGLLLVNIIQPWEGFDPEIKAKLLAENAGTAAQKIGKATEVKENGPLQPLLDIIPNNIIDAAADNRNMLKVIFFSAIFGIGLISVEKKHSQPVLAFFDGVTAIIIKMVNVFMLIAPLGTFALIGFLVADNGPDILLNVLKYGLTVIAGLLLMIFGIYPLMLKLFTKQKPGPFLKKIMPAQLLAFSTSSSAATLPVTMECVRDKIGVSDEVTSFVLPLGATINMDGTSCYQAIAAVFIANAMGIDLTFMDQLTIVLTATLASIGTAAVPSAGIVMLAIVLGQLGVPMQGIAIIIGVDRLLDMCRTVVNVTGDATVATIVAHKTGQLNVTN